MVTVPAPATGVSLTQAEPLSFPTLTPIQRLMQSSAHDPSEPELLLGIYLTGVGEKELLFFPSQEEKGLKCKHTVVCHHGFNNMGRDVPRE